MTVLVVVQARTGSSRLPGKVLAPFGGRPMLGFQLARLAVSPPGTVVVATSTLDRDDAVAAVAEAAHVPVVRGDEDDVLSRYLAALEAHPADHVVRLTADCPLTDPALVADVVDLHLASGADYTSNVHPRSYPKGLDVEVIRAEVLRAAAAEAADDLEREHVTPFVVRRPERFALATAWSGDAGLGREWWTVDEPEDLADLQATVDTLGDPVAAPWRDVLAARGIRRAAAPGDAWVRPTAPPETGSSPWTIRWEVVRDDTVEATAAVSVADGVGTVVHDPEPPTAEVAALVDEAVASSVQVSRAARG